MPHAHRNSTAIHHPPGCCCPGCMRVKTMPTVLAHPHHGGKHNCTEVGHHPPGCQCSQCTHREHPINCTNEHNHHNISMPITLNITTPDHHAHNKSGHSSNCTCAQCMSQRHHPFDKHNCTDQHNITQPHHNHTIIHQASLNIKPAPPKQGNTAVAIGIAAAALALVCIITALFAYMQRRRKQAKEMKKGRDNT